MGDWFTSTSTSEGISIDEIPFVSRRSPVLSMNGSVASSQPLASSIGLDILRKGGNAAEAAIAVAAALCVTEPCSTGLGGDMFCLYFDSKQRKVSCINGSGRSPSNLTLEVLRRDCGDGNGGVDLDAFDISPHAVTVPGAARGYEDLLNRHGSGKFTMAQLLEPAAKLAEEGFPVAPVTAHHWRTGMGLIQQWVQQDDPIPLTLDGKRSPAPGEVFVNPDMAQILRDFGKHGASKGFYEGTAGKAIAEAVQRHGGCMSENDLAQHTSTFPNPIATDYRGVRLWQVPPNGQGIAGLIALSGVRHLEETGACKIISPETIGKADAYHVMIEMMRLGFADCRQYVADPDHVPVSTDWILDSDRIGKRAGQLFKADKASIKGTALPSSCTVSFQVVDGEGNAISFVNSNFKGFGTGIVPKGCGFTLQNRGSGFSVDPNHPNVIAPNKRPYHTIIPGKLLFPVCS